MQKTNITASEYAKNEIEKSKIRDFEQKVMLSNNNYINWLKDFTEKYPKFRDDDFLYNNKKINKQDLDNINNLILLFKAIDNYAKDNYIYPINEEVFVDYYKIQYEGIGYEIGLICGQGTYCFCERVDNPDNSYINFDDIMLNKPQINTQLIKNKLKELSDIILYYYKQGVPYLALKETIENILWDIKGLNDTKNKTLRKTL